MKKLLLLLSLFYASTSLYAAGFDCTKASTQVEKTICSNPDLSALDDALSTVYKKLINPSLCADYQIPYIKDDQKAWLNETRNKCTDARCLSKVYSERINEMNEAIAPPLPARADSENITGTYQTRCYGVAGLGGGELRLKATSDGQVQFLFNCNRGAPSYNMGFLDGVIKLKPKSTADYTAPKNEYDNGDCAMKFDYSDGSKIKVTQTGDSAACGFGMGVTCEGDYELTNSDIPDMTLP